MLTTRPVYEVHCHHVGVDKKEVKASFKLQEPFANHYLYCHAVDDHNNHRHKLPSIEDTWGTHRWENRVFGFLIAVSEINSWLAFRYFVWHNNDMELLKFRKNLVSSRKKNKKKRLGRKGSIKGCIRW